MRADLLWLAEKTRKGIGTYSDSTTTKATDPSIGPYPFTGERAGKPAKTLLPEKGNLPGTEFIMMFFFYYYRYINLGFQSVYTLKSLNLRIRISYFKQTNYERNH
jgi:hypothetical protein